MSRGHDRERDIKNYLEAGGYVCLRAAGSLGPIDVVAMRRDMPTMFIEVKSTSGGPYERFGPMDRAEMASLAAAAGAKAWLAWWPKCKPGQAKLDALKWIPSSDWPTGRAK